MRRFTHGSGLTRRQFPTTSRPSLPKRTSSQSTTSLSPSIPTKRRRSFRGLRRHPMNLSRTELLNEFTYGWWECDRWQYPIIQQLSDDLAAIKSVNGEGGSGGKPKSKPPMDLSDMDLISDCLSE